MCVCVCVCVCACVGGVGVCGCGWMGGSAGGWVGGVGASVSVGAGVYNDISLTTGCAEINFFQAAAAVVQATSASQLVTTAGQTPTV